MSGAISRREYAAVEVTGAELSPYMERKVAQAAEDDRAGTRIARTYLEGAAVIAVRAMELAEDLSVEAMQTAVHTPLDAARYQGFIEEFMITAHRTMRAYGSRL